MKFGILGAGPSGLTMGLFLKYPNEVLEKTDRVGGHAGSFYDRGYTFDYGPHIMFSKNKEVLEFMKATLGKNIWKTTRNNKIYFKGKFVKYPFENDLKSLPLQDNYECLYTYLFNPYREKYKSPKNLEQWLLKHFGKGICEKYLFPYNEKVWNIPVKKLSMIWSARIPNPPAQDVIKSSIGFETEGYLHQLYYYYPLRGGYQALSDRWAKKANIRYNFEVKSILKTSQGLFVVSNGEKTIEYDKLISTIPIYELLKVVKFNVPKKVKNAVSKLIINPMYVVSLGIRGEDKNKYTALYFPEKDFLVNRVSFPKTLSPFNAPEGNYSIQAEITCRRNSKEWRLPDKEILSHVRDGLIRRGLIKSAKNVVYETVKRENHAYVVYDNGYEENAKLVRKWFLDQGIYLVGRFSYFEYVNIDGVIERSMKVASEINSSTVDLQKILTKLEINDKI